MLSALCVPIMLQKGLEISKGVLRVSTVHAVPGAARVGGGDNGEDVHTPAPRDHQLVCRVTQGLIRVDPACMKQGSHSIMM